MRNPKSATFQSLVYALGLILIAVSLTEFYYGNTLADTLEDYEIKEERFHNVRDDLINVNRESWYNLMDLNNLDLSTSLYRNYFPWKLSEDEALIGIEMLAGINVYNFGLFQSAYMDNIEDPEINWLFTEHVFMFSWLGPESLLSDIQSFYSTEYGVDISEWDTDMVQLGSDVTFQYEYTYDILFDIQSQAYVPFSIFVNFSEFDNYVFENILDPKLEVEGTMSLLTATATANTMGILILGFVIDFEAVGPKWKTIYFVLAIISVTSGGLFSYTTYIG